MTGKVLYVFLVCSELLLARTYTSSFRLAETTISESGNWVNGGTYGWNNCYTSAGFIGGVGPASTQYADPTCLLTGTWGANQTVQATVHVTSATAVYFQEVEIRLRSTMTSTGCGPGGSQPCNTGYEINCAVTGSHNYVQIIRWNGALADFTQLPNQAGNGGSCGEGDVLKGTINGSGVIQAYINGTLVAQSTDTTFTSGNPGLGFDFGCDSTYANFGFTTAIFTDNATITADCTQAAVAAAITAASSGGTIAIAAGSCAWSTGVTIPSNKTLTLQGVYSGRIVAYDAGTHTIGTGSLTITVAGYSPGFSGSVFTTGAVFRVAENNARTNWMQGTVTSFSGSTLVLNITATNGTGSTHRWLISTLPATTITNNSSTALFTINESTTGNSSLTGIKIASGSGAGVDVVTAFVNNGNPILLHDLWMETVIGSGELIDSTTNRGVVWNCSFDGTSAGPGQLVTTAALRIKGAPTTSWTTASTMGTADTTGASNFYFETNDLHAYLSASDLDDNGRTVWRYNLMDNATLGTHGADTSNYGNRHFEFYNNTGVFNGYNDGTTFNLANGWVGLFRGGTGVIYNNTLPTITSTDYGTKPDINATVMNLGRNGGPDPCWGINTTGGSVYHAPRQVGMGYVTGTGTDGLGRSTDSITYVGDSEPFYVWGNSRSPLTITLSDYASGQGDSCAGTPDTSANYIVSNRDYFNGATAKPGWAPYTYPHPLTGGVSSPVISTTCPMQSGTINVAYSQTAIASGSPTPTWDLSTGALPSGITISSAGLVSGTPTVSGTANFTLRATNSQGTDTKACSIFISSGAPTATVKSSGGAMGIAAAKSVN